MNDFSSSFPADIDECTDASSCDATTSSCSNTEGGFDCICLDGFEKNTDGDCEGRFMLHSNRFKIA